MLFKVSCSFNTYSLSLEKTLNTRIIVAVLGGDGSLGCFLDMITEDKYVAENLNKIHFTPLPFGNGNDICISLGWGKKEGQLATDIGYLVK